MVNPTLAPRHPVCTICREVKVVEDVTRRLYDEELNHLPPMAAIDYCRSVGMAGDNRALRQRVYAHRKHVDQFIARGAQIIPLHVIDGVSRIEPPSGPARWIDVNQQGMDVGKQALGIIASRLGQMADQDVIGVAKLGQVAAAKRADLEMKGALKRAEAMARYASGLERPEA